MIGDTEGKKGEQSEGIRNIRFLCNFTKYIAVHFAVFNRVFMIGLIENVVFVQSWKLMQLFGGNNQCKEYKA